MGDIAQLKNSRGAHLGWLKLRVEAAQKVKDEDAEEAVASTLGKLRDQLQKLMKVEADLELLVDPNETESFIADHGTLIESAESEIIKLEIKLRNVTVPLAKDIQPTPDNAKNIQPALDSDPDECPSHASETRFNVKFRLPKLEAKKFSGDPMKWLEWQDCFRTMIASEPSLDDTARMIYLKMLVEGEPARIIGGLSSQGTNYSIAWNRLEERYGKIEVLKEQLINQLYGLPVCKDDKDLQNVRRFVDQVIMNVSQLESLNVDVTAELGTGLLPRLRNKLPDSWQLEWARWIEKSEDPNDRNFDVFLKFLEIELRVREEAFRSKCGTKPEPQMTAAALVGVSRPQKQEKRSDRKPPVCTFCSSEHYPRLCTVDMDAKTRRSIVDNKKGCLKCGMVNHRRDRCHWKTKCKKCSGSHIELLCTETNDVSPSNPPPPPSSTSSSSYIRNNVVNSKATYLKTCAVKVNGFITTRALIDTGCSKTFIRREVALAAQAKVIDRKSMMVESFRGHMVMEEFDIVRIQVSGLNTSYPLDVEAIVDDNPVSGDFDKVPNDVGQNIVNSGFKPLADATDLTTLGIIFGEDVYDWIVTGSAILMNNGFKVTPSHFGWFVHGTNPCSSESCQLIRVFRANVIDDAQLEKFWDLEHLGITEEIETSAKEMICSKLTHLPDGRWECGFPWKSDDLVPDENRSIAEKRLKRLEHSLSSEQMKLYEEAVDEFLKEGYAEPVPDIPDGPISYLPHRPVFKEGSSTTKARVCFDATAKRKDGVSVNDVLHPGPSLLPDMFGVLLRFRMGRFGVCGDIARAFLRIQLVKEDRDICRFLWKGKEFRMTCVLFGITSSPAMLQLTIDEHLKQLSSRPEFSFTIDFLRHSLFVDDMVGSVHEEATCKKVINEAVDIFKEANMDLRKLRSSCPGLSDQNMPTVGKELGIEWDSDNDLLELVDRIEIQGKITKRGISSVLARVYDPFGFMSPLLTSLKILMQDCWIHGCKWDESLPDELQERAVTAIGDVKAWTSLKIPRWVGYVPGDSLQLHVFVDASERLYACCVYLRISSNDAVRIVLLASKARLVPIKKLEQGFSPKLELLGCCIGAKLGLTVKDHLTSVYKKDIRIWFWTDSTICLHWIHGNSSKYECFVRNRVRDLRAVPGVWGYVPTACNPADIPTRGGVSLDTLRDCKLWWNGPPWLENESSWPVFELPKGTVISVGLVVYAEIPSTIDELVNTKSVSRWRILVRAVVRLLRWIRKETVSSDITADEEIFATSRICKEVQSFHFHEEIKSLSEHSPLKKKSRLINFDPFLDESGLIRMGGRLGRVESLTYDQRHPLILARCGSIELLILYHHEKLCHAGPSVVLAELRKAGYWILRGKQVVGNVINKCRRCYRFKAAPYVQTSTVSLPPDRVSFSRPFQITGMDLGGPLVLKSGEKVWFCVFTCMEVRAVHLELVAGLSMEDTGRALSRFTNRRGNPTTIWSDHGTNFVALSRWCREQNVPIRWKFIAERSPWWGGVWERMVGLVKNLLKRVLGRGSFTWEELETMLIDVERVVNKRPISFVWENASDGKIPLPISPEDFLISSTSTKQDIEVSDIDSLRLKLTAHSEWISELKKLWESEYLLTVLGSLGRVWKEGQDCEPKIGDVVLIYDDGKRQTWKLAKVIKLHVGYDDKVRAATVAHSRGQLTRPVQKLYPLEFAELNEPAQVISQDTHFDRNVTDSNDDDINDDMIVTSDVDDAGDDSFHDDIGFRNPEFNRRGRQINVPLRFRD